MIILRFPVGGEFFLDSGFFRAGFPFPGSLSSLKNAERTAQSGRTTEADSGAAGAESPNQGTAFDWNAVLKSVSKGLHSPPPWLASVKVRAVEGNSVRLETENQFQADWAKNHYLGLIREETERIYGSGLFEIDIVAGEKRRGGKASRNGRGRPEPNGDLPETGGAAHSINLGNSFENFIVGPSNQFAHAAALAIADRPGLAYNPLFIHSGTGLGKTHLLHSIGNHIMKKNGAGLKTFCMSAENFTNGVIQGLKTNSMEKFRNRYRFNCDVLLIDDIQFIAGKESTQEEFFHTFNSLYTAKKQIVMTSDKPPSAMQRFEERLKSRFEWGLTADIQPPEVETKLAIIEKKSEAERVEVPADVASLIAKSVSNVRELEGSLNKILAYSKMFSKEVDFETAKALLRDLTRKEPPKIITIDLIQKEVSDFFSITVKDMKSNQKQKKFSEPRQIAMFLSRKYTTSSFPEIGSKFGGKNHSTVVHAVKNVEKKMISDRSVASTVSVLSTSLEKLIGPLNY